MPDREFESIYRVYFSDIYHYLLKISGDSYIAEDITSETFFKALRKIDTFCGDCDIRIWLCKIAKNSYFSYMRRTRKVDYFETVLDQHDAIADSIDEQLITTDAAIHIHATLNRLDKTHREVFDLRVLGDLSFKQIATIFCKTENWACVTYHRAKMKIRNELGDTKNNG